MNFSKHTIKARHVINCAGINGDKIHNELIRNNNINFLYPHDQMNEFTIKPRKGQFVVFENINNEIAVDEWDDPSVYSPAHMIVLATIMQICTLKRDYVRIGYYAERFGGVPA